MRTQRAAHASESCHWQIQFGYIVMFAAVAPWASFFCVLINQFDLRADGWKMLYGHQRDRYDGTTTSIGIWCAAAYMRPHLPTSSGTAPSFPSPLSLGHPMHCHRNAHPPNFTLPHQGVVAPLNLAASTPRAQARLT